MKEIKAIIPPHRLPKIRSAMRNLKNFPGMTVTDRESTRLNSSHVSESRMPSSA